MLYLVITRQIQSIQATRPSGHLLGCTSGQRGPEHTFSSIRNQMLTADQCAILWQCHQPQSSVRGPVAETREAQNTNFMANCISRGGMLFTICPKVASLMFPSTEAAPKNWA